MLSRILFCLLSVFSSQFFTHIGVEDGLSQVTVTGIVQDSDGQMWFGTQNGLNRYDGFDINVYYHDEGNPASIASDKIHCLFVDSKGRLWISTGAGIDLFDRDNDGFRHITSNNIRCLSIFERSDGVLYFGGGNLLLTAEDNDAGGFEIRELTIPGKGDNHYVCGSHDSLYISSGTRIYRHDSTSGTMNIVDFIPPVQGITNLMLRDGEIWIATSHSGVFRACLETKSIISYTAGAGGTGLCSDNVSMLCQDKDGNIWIGTGMNASIFNPKTQVFSTILSDKLDPRALSFNSVTTLYCDKDGGIWLGTFYGGVNYYNKARNRFNTFKFNHPLSEDVTGGIGIDANGKIWFGTNRNGIHIYDPATGSAEHLLLSGNPTENDIKSILFSSDGRSAYICSANAGLHVKDLTTGKMSDYRHFKNPTMLYSLVEDKDGNLWTGGMSGLYLLDKTSGIMDKVHIGGVSHLPVFKIILDTEGFFWIGAENCLLRCRLSKGRDGKPECREMTEISNVSMVQDIMQGSDGTVWIATKKGLTCWRNGVTAMIDLKFPSKMLRSLEEDRDGNLWIGTENGLCRFNPKTSETRVFSTSDGLPSNTFTAYAHAMDRDGTLYFGGLNGVVCFKAESMEFEATPTVPFIKSLTFGNRKHDIRIKFGVCDYVSWKKGVFRYRLEGYDKEFRLSEESRTATYSNVPRGRYVFRLEYANSEGQWSKAEEAPVIKVPAPWFLSFPMLLLYISILVLSAMKIVTSAIRKSEERNRREMEERIKEQKAENEKLRELSEYNQRKAICLKYAKTEYVSDEDYDLLARADKIIRDNLSNENFSVEQLTDLMGVSRSAFHRKITSITGEPALQFIKQIKFDEACRLLSSGKFTISEVSYRMGFKNPSYFSTSFKSFVGLNPREYLKVAGHSTNSK